MNFQMDIYKTYVRPLIEYNSQVWSPHLIADIDNDEKVQRFFTKRLPGMWNILYQERLNVLELKSLEVRRIEYDLILLYKLVNGLVDMDSDGFFTYNQNNTRGHNSRINIQSSRLNCRKYFFIDRTVPIWNALPPRLIENSCIGKFKSDLKVLDLSMYCRGRAHTAE